MLFKLLKYYFKLILQSIFLLYFVTSKSACATTYPSIEEILASPDHQIDLAVARLVIEKEAYLGTNINESLQQIDKIIVTIRNMPEYGDTSLEKMGTVLRYIYTPGPWNNYTAYQYDLDDPFGKINPAGKSIANYLSTKKGNCVSMPLLVTILGQRLGVNINLSIAPHHAFARYTDENNVVTNIEATSGTLLTDKKYITAFEISPEAIRQGIYLQDLTKKETIAFMLYEVGKMHMLKGQYEKAHYIADLMLKYHPKQVSAMLLKGNIYSLQLNMELRYLKDNNLPITAAVRERLDPIYEKNLIWFSRAEALGWHEPSPNFDEKYARSIERFKARNQ